LVWDHSDIIFPVISIDKPQTVDMVDVKNILSRWVEKEEAEKYIGRIKNEIAGLIEFNLHFWVAREDGVVVGISGLCDPLPKILGFSETDKPGELKILYLDPRFRGKGIGKILLKFIEDKAKREGYKEILVRSAERFKDTAYAFYEKMGYIKVGTVSSDTNSEQMQVFLKRL
jgi:GNAT superfamily N-acetyltransferase